MSNAQECTQSCGCVTTSINHRPTLWKACNGFFYLLTYGVVMTQFDTCLKLHKVDLLSVTRAKKKNLTYGNKILSLYDPAPGLAEKIVLGY